MVVYGLSSHLFSQTIELRSGLGLSTLQNSSGDKLAQHPLAKPAMAIGMNYHERRYFSIYSNVAFLTRGGQGRTPHFDGPAGNEFYETIDGPQANYVSLSSGVKFKLPLGLVSPYLIGGPRVDYNVWDNRRIGFPTKFLYGAEVGAGIDVNLSPKTYIGISGKYLSSFNNIITGSDFKDRTVVFDIGIGIRLR